MISLLDVSYTALNPEAVKGLRTFRLDLRYRLQWTKREFVGPALDVRPTGQFDVSIDPDGLAISCTHHVAYHDLPLRRTWAEIMAVTIQPAPSLSSRVLRPDVYAAHYQAIAQSISIARPEIIAPIQREMIDYLRSGNTDHSVWYYTAPFAPARGLLFDISHYILQNPVDGEERRDGH